MYVFYQKEKPSFVAAIYTIKIMCKQANASKLLQQDILIESERCNSVELR